MNLLHIYAMLMQVLPSFPSMDQQEDTRAGLQKQTFIFICRREEIYDEKICTIAVCRIDSRRIDSMFGGRRLRHSGTGSCHNRG